MPSYSKENKDYHKSRIRAVLVISPGASVREIQQSLGAGKTPLKLHHDYINKLKNAIFKERSKRNHKEINQRISSLQDKLQKIDEQLWQIAASPDSSKRDKVTALKALAEHELKLLQAEMDAGVYTRKLGEVEIEARRNQPIDPDHEKRTLQAFENWGFIEAEAREIKNENDTTQPPSQISASAT
jgi:hypothetical protein